MSLELVPDEPDPWKETGSGIADSIQTVTVEDVKPAGLNVRLANGMLGFIPRGELKIKEGIRDTEKIRRGRSVESVRAPHRAEQPEAHTQRNGSSQARKNALTTKTS